MHRRVASVGGAFFRFSGSGFRVPVSGFRFPEKRMPMDWWGGENERFPVSGLRVTGYGKDSLGGIAMGDSNG